MYIMYVLLKGYLLKGKYWIRETVGWEAAGINYEAMDVRWNQRVMIREFFLNGFIKRLGELGAIMIRSEKGKEDFLRESRILISLSWHGNSHMADAFDYFEENHTVYLVMKYPDGIPLDWYLKQYGTLSEGEILHLFYQVAEPLQRIHHNGILHKAIRPSHLILKKGMELSLTNIQMTADIKKEAEYGYPMASISYPYPPEEYMDRINDICCPWTDVYSLPMSMYKCLTGIYPEHPVNVLCGSRVKTPSELGINVSHQMEEAIMRGLNSNIKDRFQNIYDFYGSL
ncbi:protein kinase [Eubacterium sp. An3]|uniref:serine/threonine protein kinase n=1 Tax=Eubacterium sp. An3 TaxID=1965628 RepID=UPI000B3ACDF8|nr:protein kinase [Eubacterium sp. An3]OUO29607.1 hypothetical protein B5F87_03640 [Eubacterium sp. An3]